MVSGNLPQFLPCDGLLVPVALRFCPAQQAEPRRPFVLGSLNKLKIFSNLVTRTYQNVFFRSCEETSTNCAWEVFDNGGTETLFQRATLVSSDLSFG